MGLTDIVDFFEGRRSGSGAWRFAVGRKTHGAFGGTFGGWVAAIAVLACRDLAGDRVPLSAEFHFLRQLSNAPARLSPRMVSSGRRMAVVAVDVMDGGGRPACEAVVSFVDREQCHDLSVRGAASGGGPGGQAGSPAGEGEEIHHGTPFAPPAGIEIPIVELLRPRLAGVIPQGIATALDVPWSEPGYEAEAACLAADLCIGPPVTAALGERWVPHPNPDLSLRFLPSEHGSEIVGIGRLDALERGVAVLGVQVWSGERLSALGQCTAILLAQR